MIDVWIRVTKYILNIGGFLLIGLLLIGIVSIAMLFGEDDFTLVDMVTGLAMIASSVFLGFFLGLVAVIFQQNDILNDILNEVKSMNGVQKKDDQKNDSSA